MQGAVIIERLAILLSGRGSNFLAIAETIRDGRLPGCEIAVVLSNKPDAPGLTAARELGLPALAVPQVGKGPEARAAHDAVMIAHLMNIKWISSASQATCGSSRRSSWRLFQTES